MSRQQHDDELFEIKNFYYIGNYQQCINEAQKLRKPSTPEVAIQRDIFTYRSYMAQNKFLVVLDEIKPSSPEEIQPLRLLAEYLSSKQKRESIVAQIDQKLASNVESDTLALVAATIYVNQNNLETAYRVLHASESLEALAFIIDILLKIDRVDLARKKLKEMQEKDDDATLTQLAQAWVNNASGGEKLQDAYYIYQELVEKYGATPLLLNGQAVALLGQGKYEEAEAALQEALDKDANYPDTLINLIVLHKHTGKTPEIASRYLSQLKDAQPDHPYIRDLKQKESEFSRICKQYGPSVSTIPT
ncbi:coatomer subunit epsilon [Tribolium castaneum]|uniref:Coatomer subunit epsilon n=1 Tax=Tribolium castaneum TaxID=7070 RepID=D6WAS4_TRICA|nr:PREDICTED: coatomer subunit epsilon [Tribolium castaneum]EEZ98676.1 Coatomer subunit epsilon-like Protein [Tribolium castaneum]|eukprot:XP_967962.1 PREDICTED: coatomer subunit epsilon [Tribolium castaneum]